MAALKLKGAGDVSQIRAWLENLNADGRFVMQTSLKIQQDIFFMRYRLPFAARVVPLLRVRERERNSSLMQIPNRAQKSKNLAAWQ